MLYIILSIVIISFIFIKSEKEFYMNNMKVVYYLRSIGVGVVFGLLIGLLIWLMFGTLLGLVLPYEDNVETIDIVALNDTTDLQKTFVVIDSDSDYVYKYIIDTENGKLVKTLRKEVVYLKEGSYEPKIVIHSTSFGNPLLYFIAIPNFSKYTNYAEIYVPQGSISSEFEVDLE